MNTAGIIAEYNPFHNGHKYHIEKTKELTGSENIVVVMSGNFVQRGEPAIIDKWARTKTALLNGCDIVIELPTIFASSTAETFAFSTVKLLNDSGIVDFLSFGSENGNLEDLQKAADIIVNETDSYKKIIKDGLNKGLSYPFVRQKAFEASYDNNEMILSGSNNILAIEYLKAIKLLNSKIIPFTLKRQGEGYNSLKLDSAFSSASGIRKAILENRIDFDSLSMPNSSKDLLYKAINSGKSPIFLNDFSKELNYCLRIKNKEYLAQILDISEGLENRILNAANSCFDITEILDSIKTKRYTYTRLQRALLHIILDIKKEDMAYYKENGYSPYIRVLGFKKDKQYLLSQLTKKSKVPVIVNFKECNMSNDKGIKHLLKMESKFTDIYFSASPSKTQRTLNQEYTNSVVII